LPISSKWCSFTRCKGYIGEESFLKKVKGKGSWQENKNKNRALQYSLLILEDKVKTIFKTSA